MSTITAKDISATEKSTACGWIFTPSYGDAAAFDYQDGEKFFYNKHTEESRLELELAGPFLCQMMVSLETFAGTPVFRWFGGLLH